MNNEKIQKNVSLSRYTTFGIGGDAKYFIEIKNKKELEWAIGVSKEFNLPFLVLGKGSNILVSDEGYEGVVIKISSKDISLDGEIVVSDSGVFLPFLASFCLERELSGLEWATGIPGTVGGAIRGNAGAFGTSISDLVIAVDVMDMNGRKRTISNNECEFGYRESIFKKNNEIILEAKMKLKKGDYKKMKEKIDQYLNYRKEKHPQEPSAGSIFKSHSINNNERNLLVQKLPDIEKFGDLIPAAFLIEQCGLKGERLGDAMVSTLHANFIINVGKAKADDVKNLIVLIKEKVKKRFGISLEEEIQYIGF